MVGNLRKCGVVETKRVCWSVKWASQWPLPSGGRRGAGVRGRCWEESFRKEVISWQVPRWNKMRLEKWPVVTLTKIVVSAIYGETLVSNG